MIYLLSYSFFQHYWFFLDALLAALLVFLLFVQGGQTFIFSLGKDKKKRTLIVNALGRKWEFTFTTLVTFGGAFFASFPLFYATSFGGAYWVWIIILFAFIIQAVSYEFRSKENNWLGKTTFDVFLFLNGILAPLLIGIAVGTFFTGSDFSISSMKIVEWHGPLRGLEAAFNLHNLSLGLTLLFLARTNALLYFNNSIEDKALMRLLGKKLRPNAISFLVFFLIFVVWLLLRTGFAYDPVNEVVSKVQYKYLHNFIEMPLLAGVFLSGVILVLIGLYKAIILNIPNQAIWYTGSGSIFAVLGILLISGFNNTSFYPSYSYLQSSLTIKNACSSLFTLKVMSLVSIIIPVVLAYIWWAWRTMNKKKLSTSELENEEGHVY